MAQSPSRGADRGATRQGRVVVVFPRAVSSAVLAVVTASCAAGTATAPDRGTPVTPLPALCYSALSVARTSFEADGGSTTGRIVSSHSGCGWTLTVPAWITASATTGTGSATVTFTVRPSTVEEVRTADIALADERIAITQDAFSPIFHNARCHKPAQVGVNTGICTAFVRLNALNGVTADLRQFGLSATYDLVYAGGGGFYDLDLLVPAGFPPGTVTIVFTGRTREGRVGTISAPLEVR